MQVIRYLKFQPQHEKPFYMVGADPAKMQATARHIDPTVGDGVEVDSEQVLAAADTDRKRQIMDHGVRAARSGTPDYYLFG